MDKGVVLELLESLPHLPKLPSKQVWFDFDEEADVLYVSFERPQGATDSELTDDGVVLRYRGDQLVGVTILNARKRMASPRASAGDSVAIGQAFPLPTGCADSWINYEAAGARNVNA